MLPDNRCAGCGVMMPDIAVAVYVKRGKRGAVGSLCAVCNERFETDHKFAKRIDAESYRAAFGAGPDDVAGTA